MNCGVGLQFVQLMANDASLRAAVGVDKGYLLLLAYLVSPAARARYASATARFRSRQTRLNKAKARAKAAAQTRPGAVGLQQPWAAAAAVNVNVSGGGGGGAAIESESDASASGSDGGASDERVMNGGDRLATSSSDDEPTHAQAQVQAGSNAVGGGSDGSTPPASDSKSADRKEWWQFRALGLSLFRCHQTPCSRPLILHSANSARLLWYPAR